MWTPDLPLSSRLRLGTRHALRHDRLVARADHRDRYPDLVLPEETLLPELGHLVPTARPAAGTPTLSEAQELARSLLGPHDHKLEHVRTAGRVALGLSALFEPDEHFLLVVAATVHDIGYAPEIAETGFHPLDGGLHLRRLGFERLGAIVAHHSHAELLAPDAATERLLHEIPREHSLLTDALVYADMHSSPAGHLIAVEQRLSDIAQRHHHPRVDERTAALRASVRRVEEALFRADHLPAASA